ncbi:MAG: hypothetical protein AAFR96_09325 [Planctomycetota bacterium]
MALTNLTATPGLTLGSPVRTGDLAYDADGGAGVFEIRDAPITDWTGNWAVVLCGSASGSGLQRMFAFRGNNGTTEENKLDCWVRSSTANRLQVETRFSDNDTIVSIPATEFNALANGRHRVLIYTDGAASVGTMHLEYLKADGTLYKTSASLPSGTQNSLASIRSATNGRFYVGGSNITTGGNCQVHTCLAAYTNANSLSALTDDEKIAILRDPTMIGLHSEVEELYDIAGDLVDATTEERILNRERIEISASNASDYRVKCPHTGHVSEPFTHLSGTPVFRPMYDVATKGQTTTGQNLRSRLNKSTANPSVFHEGICAEDPSNDLHYYRSLVDADTLLRLKEPVPFDPVRYNGTTELLGYLNGPRDTHNALILWEVGGKLVGYPSGHDADDGTYFDVVQFVIEQDGDGMQSHVRPSIGGAALADLGTSYVQGLVTADGKLLLDTRESLGGSRRHLVLLFDPSDNSTGYQFVTTTPNASSDGNKVGLPCGIFPLPGTEVLLTQFMLSEEDREASLGGIIVDTANFTSKSGWRMAGSGEACDGLSGRPDLGSIDPGDEGFLIDRDNAGVADASKDAVVISSPMYKSNTLITLRGIDSGAFESPTRDVTEWRLTTYTYAGGRFTEDNDQDVTSVVVGAGANQIAENELDDKQLHHISGVYDAPGKAGVYIPIIEQDGVPLNTSTNAYANTQIWGGRMRFLVVPSLTDLSQAYMSDESIDLTNLGALSARMGSITGAVASNGLIPVEKLIYKPDTGANAGHAYLEPVDVSAVIDELPAAGGGSSVRGLRGTRGETVGGVRGARAA